MTITITAFERSPDRGKGLARDMRVRWALEEVDQPYEVRLLSFEAMKEPAHLALHPLQPGVEPDYKDNIESERAFVGSEANVVDRGTARPKFVTSRKGDRWSAPQQT